MARLLPQAGLLPQAAGARHQLRRLGASWNQRLALECHCPPGQEQVSLLQTRQWAFLQMQALPLVLQVLGQVLVPAVEAHGQAGFQVLCRGHNHSVLLNFHGDETQIVLLGSK